MRGRRATARSSPGRRSWPGLLGLGLDEIVRRAERARRRRNRIFGALAGVFLLLAVAATGSAVYAWQQLKTNEAFLNATLQTATEIVNTAVAQAEKYNVPRTATLDLLARAEVLFDNMAQYGRATPELRYRKASMLIEFARNYEVLGDTGKQLARASEAHRLLAGLAAEKPDDLAYQRELSVALHAVGNVLRARGQLEEALASYRASLVIRERLAAADPSNATWQRDLSWAHNNLGDALEGQGKLDAALASYRKSLAICETMAAAEPNDAVWQRSLSMALGRIADVLYAQGKLDEALAGYRAVHDRLAAAEAGNVSWLRERSVALGKIGDVLRDQDKLDEALASYRASQAIDQRLIAIDPSNVGWQHDLSSSHERIGNVLRVQWEFAGALREYEAKRAIMTRLTATDPGNAGFQRDLSVANHKIGDVLRYQGKLDQALATYRETLVIDERLAAADPSNAEWQRDLSVAYERIGAVLRAQRKFDDALTSYRASLAIRERIARANPINSKWQRDYAVGHAWLGLTYRDMRKFDEALSEFRQGRQIMAALVERAPGFPQWEKELASFERDVAAHGAAAAVGTEVTRGPARFPYAPNSSFVMAGLVPAIHVLLDAQRKTWMPGTRPGMTAERLERSKRETVLVYKMNRLKSAFLAEVADVLVHIGGVDLDVVAAAVGRRERNLVEHALHHGVQPPRPDVLDRGIDRDRHVRDGVDRIRRELERHALGLHQRHVLLDQRGLGLGQDPAEIVARERAQLDPDRQPALQLRQQVRRLREMERARGDEQDVVGLHRSMLGRDRGALDQREEIALHALARHVGAVAAFAAGDLVDLVEEHDAVLLDRLDRFQHHLVGVEQLVGFLGDQDLVGLRDRHAPRLGAAAAELAEDVADRDRAHLGARHAGDLEHRHAAATGLHLDLDLLVVHFAGTQPLAKDLLGRGAGVLADQRVDHAVLGGLLGARLHVLALAFAGQRDRDLDEVAHDLLDVAPHIADLGELGGLDLEERGARELGEPARDLGLAHTGRADHQDVLGQHLLAQLVVELQPPPAVAQRDRDRALGVGLADDETVELGDDFAGGEVGHRVTGTFWRISRKSGHRFSEKDMRTLRLYGRGAIACHALMASDG